jgi:hypothetical protein
MESPSADPLDGAPPEDRETLRAALVELYTALGTLPEPEIQEESFALIWRVPEGFIQIAAPGGSFAWFSDGPIFEVPGWSSIPWGSSVHPTPGSPEALFGGTLVPRFRLLLARHAELEALRDRLLVELKKTSAPREFLRQLLGPVMKALPDVKKG